MNPLLDIKNLNVSFKLGEKEIFVAHHVSFQINRGEIMGLIGESGCGKTLTTLSLTGLLPKKARLCFDRYQFNEQPLTASLDALRTLRGRGIATIFQEPGAHLNPLFPVGDQIQETILCHTRLSKTEARIAMRRLLENVGLKPAAQFEKRYAHQCSGGMNQRVMIALALSCQPRLLVADEPTTALDIKTKNDIIALVKKITTEQQLSVIWISHDISLMEGFADRISVMYAGHLVETGKGADVLKSPAHPYTQGLIACLPRHASGKKFHTLPGEVPNLLQLPLGCPFHPRCPYVMDRCRQEDPDLFSKTPTQKARCFLLQKT
jgi:peptide/nickel transport system ATP-binding protein